jgi:DNA-binding transcriptional LysR family regulator
MDLRQLRTFVVVADTGGVARAALRLNLSQPAASRQIQVLEADLGVRLFDRVGRRVRLTAAGEDLLRRSHRLLGEADAFRERARALQSGQAGVLRIGATSPMVEAVLASFLPAYRRRHAGIEVHVVEDGGAGLAARLERGEVHIAYVPAGDDRFAGRLLYPIHVMAVAPVRHPIHRHRALEIATLAGERLLVLRRDFGSREWFDAACAAAGIRPNILLESSAHNAVLSLAAAGYGIGVLPSAVRLADRRLRSVPLVSRGVPIGRWTMLAWDPRRFLAPFARVFVDELVAHAQRSKRCADPTFNGAT